jgi:DNA-binding transcriptional regulator YhcF (GntR family)
MNFNANQSIYLQIADFVKERILSDQWRKEDKIPSVRDLAIELQVNPNTVMRAYDLLQQQGILYNRRGLGNYVSADAGNKILADRKEYFKQSELPVLFRTMHLLGVSFNELEGLYKNYVKENNKTK